MHHHRLAASISVLGLLLGACAAGPAPDPTQNDGDPNGTWQLVEGSANGQPVPVLDEHRITITIEGSQLGGTAACNGYGARVTSEDGRLRVVDLASTAMGCVEPAMAAEAFYLRALAAAEAITLDGDELLIRGPDVELRFAELPPPPTADMVDTVWLLDTLTVGDVGSSAVGEVATLELRSDGTIHGSTGCRSFDGTWLEQGDEIVTPSLAMDDRACPAGLQDMDGHVVAVIGDGFRASIDGDQLTLTDSGGLGLVYRAAE